jgi:hypothetical protein
MTSNKNLSALKILIVAACLYSMFWLFISPNENKDLHLVVTLIGGSLAAIVTICEKHK